MGLVKYNDPSKMKLKISDAMSAQHRRNAESALELMDSGMLANGLIGGTAYWAKTLDSFRVMSEDIGGDNIARLNIELTDKQGKTKSHTLRFVSEENQWFPILHVWSQGTTNLRASLEMPPEFAFGAR